MKNFTDCLPSQENMKTLVLTVLVLVLTVAAASRVQEEWESWKKTYNKVYDSPSEEARRHKIWMKNREYVREHNSNYRIHGFTLAVNQFADTDESDMKQRNGLLPEKVTEKEVRKHLVHLDFDFNGTFPNSIDWREKGAVLQVKNQGHCGSCWSFGITGTIEGQNHIQNNIKVSLSEQNLIDCSWLYGNYGCNGGQATATYQYIIDNGGIDTEESYPYTATDSEHCKYNSTNKGASITDFKILPTNDEMALVAAIANVGPIAVSIDASQKSFKFYNGTGIYYEPSCSSIHLGHMVLAVGYGSEDGNDYYIVKNSWGASWGANGYIKMARNRNNSCGIATRASYPIM